MAEGDKSSTTVPVAVSEPQPLDPGVVLAIQQAVDHAFKVRVDSLMLPQPGSSSTSSAVPLSSVAATEASPATHEGTSGGKSPAVPPFLNTFANFGKPFDPISINTGVLPSTCASKNIAAGHGLLPIIPSLGQPFVVGPGYSPIPAKLVNQIVSGKFVDLNELLPANLSPASESEPQLLLDGRLVLANAPKKPKRRFEDIVSWVEAFSVYSLVMTSRFPQRWRDLLQYKLLIVRTYRLFSGRAWLAYDIAFREHAAAANIVDWSQINVQLYNFHTAGSSPRSSNPVCISWNKGHCSSPYSPCRFAHHCQKCSGQHKALDCPESKSMGSKRGRSASPGVYQAKDRKR